MMNDVSATGLSLLVQASTTFPAGILVTAFADDADPFDLPAVDIAQTGMDSPIKINIRDEHKATTFQVESGETRSDHVVVQAVEIGMDLILSGEIKNAFGLMQQAWEQNKLVGIQTRVKTYQPMLLVNFYHDETAEMADAIQLSLRFTEWRSVTPEYGDLPPKKVQKPSQSSTVKRGGAQTKSVSEERKKSVLVRVLGG